MQLHCSRRVSSPAPPCHPLPSPGAEAPVWIFGGTVVTTLGRCEGDKPRACLCHAPVPALFMRDVELQENPPESWDFLVNVRRTLLDTTFRKLSLVVLHIHS